MHKFLFTALPLIFGVLLTAPALKAENAPDETPAAVDDASPGIDPDDSFGPLMATDDPVPPPPPEESPAPRLRDLQYEIANLSGRVDAYCKAPHDALVKIPRVESFRQLDDSLELIRSYEQPTVYAAVGEPLLVYFPGKISGGFKRRVSNLAIERGEDYLVLFAEKSLPPEGEALLVRSDDLNFYSFRVKLADQEHKPDVKVRLGLPK